MIVGYSKIRRSGERGHVNHGWLDTYHTFSFGDYFDPEYCGFRSLRVLNDDTVDAGHGFDSHPHKNMEIISYVIEGELAHKDNHGHASTIVAGYAQRMTAGTGIVHSEYNPSQTHKARFLQIWIVPDKESLTPSYQEFALNQPKNPHSLTLIASTDEKDRVLRIHQDVKIYRGQLMEGEKVSYSLKKGRAVWIQMIEGSLLVNDEEISRGDGITIENIQQVDLLGFTRSHFLLLDL